MQTKKAFVSWSGGKDCCLSAYYASRQGMIIKYLLNMVTQDEQRSCSHWMASQWIRLQADAMEIPLLQYPTTVDNYASVFVNALHHLKNEGVSTGIFGDIDFGPHLEWIENICVPSGITPVLPLWNEDQNKVIKDFIELDFKAKIVATKADILGQEWLGRIVDKEFVKELRDMNTDITPCGEAGEFHTLVVDGPLFKKRLDIVDAANVKRGEHWFLDIKKVALTDK